MEYQLKNTQTDLKRRKNEIDDLNKIIASMSKKPAFAQKKETVNDSAKVGSKGLA